MIKQHKHIKAGIKSDLIIFILNIVMGFAIVPIYLVYLSMEEFGFFVAVQGLVALLALADIGMGTYVVKKLSNEDYFDKHAKEFLSTMQIFQYFVGCVLLIIGLIAYYFVDDLLNVDKSYSNIVSLLFLFSWFSIVIKIWFSLGQAVLRAKGKLAYINIATFTIFLLTSFFNIVFLHFGYGLVGLGISLLVSTIIVNIVMINKIHKEHDIFLLFPNIYLNVYIVAGWNYIKKLQVLKIAQVSKTSLFTVLLANYSGAIIIAQYNLTNKMPSMFPALLSKLSINYFTRFSSLYEKNQIDLLREEYETLFVFGVKSTIFILVSLYFLNELFISIWVGDDKYIGYYIFIVMLMNIGVLLLTSFTGLIIQISGEFHKMPILSVFEVILLLTTTYIFFNFFGTIGVISALLLSSLPTLFYSLYVVKKILKLNYHLILLKQLPNILFFVISILIVNYVFKFFVSNDILKLISLSLIFFIIFFGTQIYYSKYTLKTILHKVLK